MSLMFKSTAIRFTIIASMFVPTEVQAQDTLAVFFGVVKDITTHEVLDGVHVEALDLKWGRRVIAITGDSGRYQINFTSEADYLLEYSAPGHVPKRIRLKLFGPTPEDWAGGFGMNVDVTLFRDLPDLDLTFHGEPFGICAYDADSGNFRWDLAYTERMRERAAKRMKAYEKRIAKKP